MTDKILTQDRLKELLNYDPETGVFTWRVCRYCVQAGETAGYLNPNGYIYIKIDGKDYRLHRLVWLYVHGIIPKQQLDHINGNRSDNRLVNLRVVTNKQNCENRKQQANNTSGYRGVHWNASANKWVARIRHHGKRHHVGVFDTAEEAGRAAKAARDMLFTHHKTEYAA